MQLHTVCSDLHLILHFLHCSFLLVPRKHNYSDMWPFLIFGYLNERKLGTLLQKSALCRASISENYQVQDLKKQNQKPVFSRFKMQRQFPMYWSQTSRKDLLRRSQAMLNKTSFHDQIRTKHLQLSSSTYTQERQKMSCSLFGSHNSYKNKTTGRTYL